MESKIKWNLFRTDLYGNQFLPPERKYVLVLLASKDRGCPAGIGVGYLRFGGGDHDSPHFVVPGTGGPVVAWCDTLPHDFKYPIEWVRKFLEDKEAGEFI